MKTKIFWATGGMGKVIASTAIIELLKKENPNDKLIVITPHPLVFKNNPYIDEIFNIKDVNKAYQKYFNKDSQILVREPYNEPSFISGKENLLKTWSKMYGLDLNNTSPQLFFEVGELDKYEKLFKSDKPIFVIHPFGGGTKEYNWVRDIHPNSAQNLVDFISKSYTVYQIKSREQRLLKGAIPAEQNVRKIAALLKMADKRLLIDSFSQHLSASLRLKSSVCWYMTQPLSYGYPINNNIVINHSQTKKYKPFTFTVPQGVNLSEPLELCPYDSPQNLHSLDKIIKELNR